MQTIYSAKFPSAPGSISQVREVATQLLFLAKGRGITTFLIGHVTKDGSLAGPKSLEHIVDTVLYFEGEKRSTTASCARSRTASARSPRWASSR